MNRKEKINKLRELRIEKNNKSFDFINDLSQSKTIEFTLEINKKISKHLKEYDSKIEKLSKDLEVTQEELDFINS